MWKVTGSVLHCGIFADRVDSLRKNRYSTERTKAFGSGCGPYAFLGFLGGTSGWMQERRWDRWRDGGGIHGWYRSQDLTVITEQCKGVAEDDRGEDLPFVAGGLGTDREAGAGWGDLRVSRADRPDQAGVPYHRLYQSGCSAGG